MEYISCTKKGTNIKYLFTVIIAIVVFVASVYLLNLDFKKFINRFSNINEVVSRLMTFDLTLIPNILLETLSSITLAFSSLVFGTIISFFLSIFAASNTAPNKVVATTIKGIITIIRAIPSLVWVLMVVASIGFGNTGGMIGLIFPTMGYLTKSFSSSIEEEGNERIEALKSTGARWIDIVLKGVIPECTPKLISWIAMRFENNVAESISLGMVGVSGIGFMLNKAIIKFDYNSISTIILTIFITMLSIELSVKYIKKNL